MSPFSRPTVTCATLARSVAFATLMCGAMLAGPLTPAHAGTAAPIQLAESDASQHHAGAGATKTRGETVEHRIASLHRALKITPDEEANWNNVAQAMRENAANMEKMVAENRTTPPQNMTAVEDLEKYQKVRPGACRRAEEFHLVVRDALQCHARRPEENRRRGLPDIRSQGRPVAWLERPGIAHRDEFMLIEGGRP